MYTKPWLSAAGLLTGTAAGLRTGAPLLAAGLSMKLTVLEAWRSRAVGWFRAGVFFIVGFAVLFGVLPRFLPRKTTRRKGYVKASLGVLALGLLLLLYSLLSGIGFGFGLGRGNGRSGIGVGAGNTNKEQKYVNEGEIDIAITGSTVYIDAEAVPLDEVRDRIKKKNKDSLTVVLIDAYSDFGTYTRVEAILNELLTETRYEKRKEILEP